uniref:Uncharacterized protein n=1 Tax=Rhizophora mucronata TaxID=61149 RepID=A0A2P2LX29_RHIMU
MGPYVDVANFPYLLDAKMPMFQPSEQCPCIRQVHSFLVGFEVKITASNPASNINGFVSRDI